MYENIKKATSPTSSKAAPIKSKSGEVITDQAEIEHYLELYATLNTVASTALKDIPDMPPMEELDATPTLEELSKAIDTLARGKAPGNDGIPPEALKMGRHCYSSSCTNF